VIAWAFFRSSSFVVGVAALALAIPTELSAQNSAKSAPPEHKAGMHMPAEGIPNFGQVDANLYRGAQPNRAGFETLKNLGVDVVVDLRGSASRSEESAVTALGMKYVSIPAHCPFPSDRPWARFLAVMRQNPGKKVFVHCRLGDDRTGMAVASYRMAEQGWSADEAMKEMQSFGFSTSHHALCPGLAEYEKKFPERMKSPAFQAQGTAK
jgi:tyrosine-protein phosphatase SIW14